MFYIDQILNIKLSVLKSMTNTFFRQSEYFNMCY